MTTKLFGTDGIRAKAGDFPLNGPSIVAIGRAIGEKLGGTVLVGEDTRASSPWILDLLQQGFRQTGARIDAAGVIPTPGVALLTQTLEYSGGIMISASHNPFEDNGIKVFSANGTKLRDGDEAGIEKRIAELLPAGAKEAADRIPAPDASKTIESQWPERYRRILLSRFPSGAWLKGMKIVMDCANGATSDVAPAVLSHLGADVHVVCAEPNGININAGCGAVHLDRLTQEMKKHQADFGVAFDGDGDRSLFVSGSGRPIDGDAVLLVMARRLKPPVVVGTSMTNFALQKKLESEGIVLTRVGVGDRFIFEEMQKSPGAIGGEPSGHVIFPDFGLSGDGLLTTLKLAQAMVESRASLDELTSDWTAAPQLLKGIRVERKLPIEEMSTLQACMKEAESALAGCGRLVVRYSGTEPLLRVMIESDDASRNDLLMEQLLEAARKDFKKDSAVF